MSGMTGVGPKKDTLSGFGVGTVCQGQCYTRNSEQIKIQTVYKNYPKAVRREK
jgi:hypothetical protein